MLVIENVCVCVLVGGGGGLAGGVAGLGGLQHVGEGDARGAPVRHIRPRAHGGVGGVGQGGVLVLYFMGQDAQAPRSSLATPCLPGTPPPPPCSCRLRGGEMRESGSGYARLQGRGELGRHTRGT